MPAGIRRLISETKEPKLKFSEQTTAQTDCFELVSLSWRFSTCSWSYCLSPAIIGAFMAGLFFERRMVGNQTYDRVKTKISGTTNGFLAPVFFASIGLQLSFDAVTATPLFLVIFVVVAVLVKVIGTSLPAYWLGLSKVEAASVGFGMCARGAVELIIADIALKAGLFSQPSPTPVIVEALFSAVVLMSVFTTLLAPIALRLIMASADSTTEQDS